VDDDSSQQRIDALETKVARLEQELTKAQLGIQRASVQHALMDERLLTLEGNRLFRLWGKVYRRAAGLYGRFRSAGRYGGLSDLRTPGDYERWVNREQQEMDAKDHSGSAGPLISVVMKLGEAECRDSLRSLAGQCYPNWELSLDGPAPAWINEEVERTRLVAAATGAYLLVLHAGDRLSPHALYFYAQALENDSPAMLYSDEDCIGADGQRTSPLFKPGWSPELLQSTLYFGRAVLYRRDLFVEAVSAWDLALSIAAQNLRVLHVPRVLYHRLGAAALEQKAPRYIAPTDSRLSLIICSREVRRVRECLEAVRYTATVPLDVLVVHHLQSGSGSNSGDEMRQYVEQFGGTWIPYRGPFDFARMNNQAAAKAAAPYLVFLNDDVIVHEAGWDQAFAARLARQEIGITGAILQYPNGTIQHAGVVVGIGDAAGHCGRFQMTSELWPWLRRSRDVSAVTGAMLGIRSEVFQRMNGFDESFPVNYNDVDLCLRVREAGLRVVCLDVGKVAHRESQTRVGGTRHKEREALYKKWANVLARPDEFYSAHLAAMERIALKSEGPGNPLRELAPTPGSQP
jgi:O-antigen biosynthesis protein